MEKKPKKPEAEVEAEESVEEEKEKEKPGKGTKIDRKKRPIDSEVRKDETVEREEEKVKPGKRSRNSTDGRDKPGSGSGSKEVKEVPKDRKKSTPTEPAEVEGAKAQDVAAILRANTAEIPKGEDTEKKRVEKLAYKARKERFYRSLVSWIPQYKNYITAISILSFHEYII